MAQKRPVRLRRTNRFKCLLCYLISFAVPLAWQAAALKYIYPYFLIGTAPNVAAQLTRSFPFTQNVLAAYAERAAAQTAPDLIKASMAARQANWFLFLCVCALLAWTLTLLLQLCWRFAHQSPVFTARQTKRAVSSYRLMQLLIFLLNAAIAFAVWFFGVRFIAGKTPWDYAVYFGVYALNALAAVCVFRLAAPPTISGRHAFSKDCK